MRHLLSEDELGELGPETLTPWLQLAAEANGIGFFNWDIARDEMRWNGDAERRVGLSPGTIDSFGTWSAFVEAEDAAKVSATVKAAQDSASARLSYRYRFHPPTGETLWMEGRARCLYDGTGTLRRLLGVNVDITEQERLGAVLDERSSLLDMIVEATPDGLVLIDADGKIQRVNQAIERMFGWSAREIVGQDVAVLMPPRQADVLTLALERRLREGPSQRPFEPIRSAFGKRRDGTSFPIEISIGEMQRDGVAFFSGFIRDITERVEAARRQEELRADFLRAARLSTMGEAAAVLAHEIGQPIAAAANFLAASAAVPGGTGGGYLEAARQQLEAAAAIVGRLRGFVANRKPGFAPIAVNELVVEAIALALPGAYAEHIEMTIDIEPTLDVVIADRVELQQALVNIIRNAVAATTTIPGNIPRLHIVAGHVDGTVRLSCIDNGPGFLPAYLLSDQQLFRSTKGEDGMGLGLAICRRIVAAHGGRLTLANEPDGGACVTIDLPELVATDEP